MTPADVERRGWPPRWAEWLDWMESGLPLPPSTALHALHGSGRSIRCEELIEDGRYIIRAELPGVDPDTQVDVTLTGDLLHITAERTQTARGQRHSEFYYGTMSRTLTLPPRSDTGHVTATYRDGLLEICVPLTTVGPSTTVPVARSS